MKTRFRSLGVFATVLVTLGLLSAAPASADPFDNPGQSWNSPNFGKASGSGSGANNLASHPASACFGSTGWIGADYTFALRANQAGRTRAHARGTVDWRFFVTFGPSPSESPKDYVGHATLDVNTIVDADPNSSSSTEYKGYAEYPLEIDMTPVAGGNAIKVIWPVQIWVVWSSNYTLVTTGLGLATCA